jgi:uncharacterized membrane protein YsdA (DUF1294 family)
MEFSTEQLVAFVVVVFAVVNAGSAVTIWWDKRRAIRGQWRIREETLLIWAVFGGWIGGIWAMRKFRHKTSKTSFIARYVVAVVVNVGAVVGIVYAAVA